MGGNLGEGYSAIARDKRRQHMVERRIQKWLKCCETWVPTFHELSIPGPAESAAEAYVLSNMRRSELNVNSFAKMLAMLPSRERHEMTAKFYAVGLRGFTQLAVIRCWAMERQRMEMKHPEAFRNRTSNWQELGFEWWLESDDDEEEAVPVRLRPPKKPRRTRSVVFDNGGSGSDSGSDTETEPVMTRKIPPRAKMSTERKQSREVLLQFLDLPPTLTFSEPDPEEEVDIPLPTSLETPVGMLNLKLLEMITEAKSFSQKLRAGPRGDRLPPLPPHLASQLPDTKTTQTVQEGGRRTDSHAPQRHSVDDSQPGYSTDLRARVRKDVKLTGEGDSSSTTAQRRSSLAVAAQVRG